MPWVVGEREAQFRSLSIYVMVGIDLVYRCWMCEKGSLQLTRDIGVKGELSPAFFECDHCHDITGIAPAKSSQGVMPALSVASIRARAKKGKGKS